MNPALGPQDASVALPTTPVIQRSSVSAAEVSSDAVKPENEAQQQPSKVEEAEKSKGKPRRPINLRIRIPLDAGPPQPPSTASASSTPKLVMTDKLRTCPWSKEFWDVLYALYWDPEDDLPRQDWRAS